MVGGSFMKNNSAKCLIIPSVERIQLLVSTSQEMPS